MVIKNPQAGEYIEPLKKLFPKGAYWNGLLSDPASDVSLICAARAETLAAFRARMNQLQRESFIDFADETISDWERIYFGYENDTLTLDQRRSLLRVVRSGGVNMAVMRQIAETYGGTFHSWKIPYTPAAFGHAQFGRDYMAGIAGMWVVFIYASVPTESRKGFEASVERAMLANQTIFFVYGE